MDEPRKRSDVNPPLLIDPSSLTTQLVLREVAALKELVLAKIDAIEDSIELSHADMVRVPTDVQKQVGTLKELAEEKFRAVHKEVSDIERSLAEIRAADANHEATNSLMALDVAKLIVSLQAHKELVSANKQEAAEAIKAAFSAAKEAVSEQNKSRDLAISKSEAAVTKQIEGLTTLLGTTANAIEGKVSDLKDRLTQIESRVEGAKESKGESRSTGQYAFTIAGFILGALGLVIGWIVSVR